MNGDQLKQILKVGRSRVAVIYCDLCDDYIGYVKTVTVMNEKLVRIEYDVYGCDEAGLTYFAEYENIETLIKSIQEYIGKDISDWENISLTNDYPQELEGDYDINAAHALIAQDMADDKIELPKYGKVSIKEGYWKNLHDKKSWHTGKWI